MSKILKWFVEGEISMFNINSTINFEQKNIVDAMGIAIKATILVVNRINLSPLEWSRFWYSTLIFGLNAVESGAIKIWINDATAIIGA